MITNMSPLVLTDAAATPVNHTFSPASRVAENTARWVDREHNGGVSLGYRTVTYSVKDPSSVEGVTRQRIALALPLVDFTIATAPKLLGVNRVHVEFITAAIASDQDRKDMVEMAKHLFLRAAADKLGDNIATASLPY